MAPVSVAPVSETPVSVAPISEAPFSAAPISAAPATEAPFSAAPLSAAPVSAVPVSAAPVFTVPVSETPVSAAPITAAPVSAAPIPTFLAPVSAAPTPALPLNPPVTQNPLPASVQRVNMSIQGVTLVFPGAEELTQQNWDLFNEKYTYWFEEFFNRPRDSKRRKLMGVYGVTDMSTKVDITNEEFTALGGNTITYTQSMAYTASSLAPPPEEVLGLPFQTPADGDALLSVLQQELPQFRSIPDGVVLRAPEIIPITGPEPVKGTTWATPPVIAGIAGGTALFLGALAFVVFFCCCWGDDDDDDDKGCDDVEESPLNHFQFTNNSEDNVSAFGDPLEMKATGTSADALSVGNYGDQSVTTVYYDYSKAYGGGGSSSVVSSVGGTLGDATRQTSAANTTNNPGTGAAAALGASYEAMRGVQEEVICIEAPPGKLGVVIDTPDDGAPLVHAVKDSSVIADLIQVGDKLIAVDDDDVQAMTAIKVSKLISKRSANPVRRLTIVYTTHVGNV